MHVKENKHPKMLGTVRASTEIDVIG
jgi:hypothetical protein